MTMDRLETRIVFMGTPELAVRVLTALDEAGYTLPLVVTQPDKAGGRGRHIGMPPVKTYAMSKGIPVYQPESLKNQEAGQRIREASPDLIVTAAYGKILPPALLETAPMGCLNVHTSLLPAYRGAAPIQWVLLNGERETGVTIMRTDEGMDTGPVLLQEKQTIPEDMDYGALYEALSALGAELLLKAVPLWIAGALSPVEQGEEASYAPLLARSHETIDWALPAETIRNQIRAFSPSPGASACIQGKEIKILGARATTTAEERLLGDMDSNAAEDMQAGQIMGILRKAGPVVATGRGNLLLTRIQPAGKNPMDAWAWLNGSRLAPGMTFVIDGE